MKNLVKKNSIHLISIKIQKAQLAISHYEPSISSLFRGSRLLLEAYEDLNSINSVKHRRTILFEMIKSLKKMVKLGISNKYECERFWLYVHKLIECFNSSKMLYNEELKPEWLNLIDFIQTKPSIYTNDLGFLCKAYYHLNEAFERIYCNLVQSLPEFLKAHSYLIEYFKENTNKYKSFARNRNIPVPASNHSFYLKVEKDFQDYYERYTQIYWIQKGIENIPFLTQL